MKARCLSGLLALACAGPAAAQWLGNDYALVGAPMSNYIASSYLNQSYLNGAGSRKTPGAGHDAGAGRTPAPLTAAQGDAQASATAKTLSARFPADRRARVEQAYKESFVGYGRLEAKLGLPKGDLGGAVAAYIAGNYMALHARSVPDEQFVRMAQQMRSVLGDSPAFARASGPERRQLYEQLATVGMFMALAQRAFESRPDPAAEQHFRDAARANLEQFLKQPADKVRIGDGGLSLR